MFPLEVEPSSSWRGDHTLTCGGGWWRWVQDYGESGIFTPNINPAPWYEVTRPKLGRFRSIYPERWHHLKVYPPVSSFADPVKRSSGSKGQMERRGSGRITTGSGSTGWAQNQQSSFDACVWKETTLRGLPAAERSAFSINDLPAVGDTVGRC